VIIIRIKEVITESLKKTINVQISVFMFVIIQTNSNIRKNEVLSRAINFVRQCHFKIWLDCHKFKNFPCLIMPMSTKCQKMRKK
jgi:hypothetical protein